MARSKINPATSVTFRMPDDKLNKIDELALKNTHDRTAEINDACRHWIEIGGVFGKENITQQKISELEKQMTELNNRMEKLESSLEKISEVMTQTDKNNSALLNIISSNEHTIKCLLQSLTESNK
ncbi:MAG: hypothetical protein Q4Q53_01890 [Methanocorpusculum sp.]|nr:hypothetical protein [Methanocorpusculum sp.]